MFFRPLTASTGGGRIRVDRLNGIAVSFTGAFNTLIIRSNDVPGKLAEVIQVIGASGFNMESIKSRPMPHVPFEYYFYVELVGDAAAGETAALLRELDRTCRTVRLLGVYTK